MALEDEARATVPGWSPEVGTRLSTLFDAVGGLAGAGRISGLSSDALANWRDGKARPALYPLVALCRAAGMSLEWLATGAAPAVPPPAPAAPARLWGTVSTRRLEEAFREALERGGLDPAPLGDTFAIMALTLLLYDASTQKEEAEKAAALSKTEKMTTSE